MQTGWRFGNRRAVVLVEVLLDVGVRDHARARGRRREVRRRRGPMRVEEVERIGTRVRLGDVADLHLALEVRGRIGVVLRGARHDGVEAGGGLRVSGGEERDVVSAFDEAARQQRRSRVRCRRAREAGSRSRSMRSARSSLEPDRSRPREQLEVFRDGRKRHGGVAARERVPDLRHGARAVREVEGLVREDISVLPGRERRLREVGARNVGEVVVVVDVQRSDDSGIAGRNSAVGGRRRGRQALAELLRLRGDRGRGRRPQARDRIELGNARRRFGPASRRRPRIRRGPPRIARVLPRRRASSASSLGASASGRPARV